MSWARMFMLGNIGQQLDIDDIESDMGSMRARLASQSLRDETQEQALLTLRAEITELKLVVGELTRLLVQNGTLPAAAAERTARAVDKPA
ncbi:MAG: hypothetical protein V4617_06355 [Gemmatimonadota bacterium]